MGLVEAAASGDRKASLEALRDVLAESIVEAPADKRAPLAQRLAEVLDKIAALEPPKREGTPLDELAKRRSGKGQAPRRARASSG